MYAKWRRARLRSSEGQANDTRGGLEEEERCWPAGIGVFGVLGVLAGGDGVLRHLLDGSGTSGDLNKISGDEGLTELVVDDGELGSELLAVLVGTVHGVTAGEGLSGSALEVGVVDGGSEGELVEVLEELILAFFEVEGDRSCVGGDDLGGGQEHLGDLEGVVGDQLVEDEHDTIVLILGDELSNAGEVVKVGDLSGVGRGDDAGRKHGLLLEGSGSLVSQDEELVLNRLSLRHANQITNELGVERSAETTVGGDDDGENFVGGSLSRGSLGELVEHGLHVEEEVR